MNYDDHMDGECIELCDALNDLPGIATFESCCGHGKAPFRIFFHCKELANLRPILEALEHNFALANGSRWSWSITVELAASFRGIYFCLEDSVGMPQQQRDLALKLRVDAVRMAKGGKH